MRNKKHKNNTIIMTSKEPILMLSSKECSACVAQKKVLDKDIKSGKVKLVPLESKQGQKLVNKYDIMYIPQLLQKDGKGYKKCELKNGKIVCE